MTREERIRQSLDNEELLSHVSRVDAELIIYTFNLNNSLHSFKAYQKEEHNRHMIKEINWMQRMLRDISFHGQIWDYLYVRYMYYLMNFKARK